MRFTKPLLLSAILNSTAFATLPPPTETSIKYPLSTKAYELLQSRIKEPKLTPALTSTQHLPEQKQLGMNNVPVLNQKTLPNEAVFASTAAIDALLGKGDFISQHCLFMLENYIDSFNQGIGFTLKHSLSRLENYGYILKQHQKEAGCENVEQFIGFKNYNKLSRDLAREDIVWFPILDLNKTLNERTNTEQTLKEIQTAISQGQRVAISFLTFKNEFSSLGVAGTYHTPNDTWLLTATMKRELAYFPILFLHSIVITGYDNNAIAVDTDGQKHQGLLTLRGSWGAGQGDHGDFYMSYDYFRVLVLEAQQITQVFM